MTTTNNPQDYHLLINFLKLTDTPNLLDLYERCRAAQGLACDWRRFVWQCPEYDGMSFEEALREFLVYEIAEQCSLQWVKMNCEF